MSCGPVRMHVELLMLSAHKVHELLILSRRHGQCLDLYACLRSCVGDSHVTVVAPCRSQDFQGLQEKWAALGF